MENASKALVMAGGVLIGILIISIGVYLFNSFSVYSEENYKIIEDIQIAEFNNKFLKYYGTKKNENGVDVPIECTIHDIVNLANLAQRNNIENQLIEEFKKGDNQYKVRENVDINNSLYIKIDLVNKTDSGTKNIEHLELKSSEFLTNLIKENDLVADESGKLTEIKYYKCIVCETKGKSGRINYVKFTVNNV